VSERSVNFDRAAEYYDRTRVTDPEALAETLGLLEREVGGRGRGRVLEIGVGTGALAVPLWERGVDVVGVDVSTAMLAQLRRKSVTMPVVAADATTLPFPDGVIGSAYARWVLHLIPAWRDVVRELMRVVRDGGVIVIEPGGYRGDWLDVWQRIEAELGPAVRHIGLSIHDGDFAELDAAFAEHGATPRDAPRLDVRSADTLGAFFDQARDRSFSWTWRVDPDVLRAGLDAVEAWAHETYGDDLDAVGSQMQMVWRIYDLPSSSLR
jgi:SAM-dependent methyltransferase